MPKYLYTFYTNVGVAAPAGHKDIILRTLNEHYTGSETLTEGQKVTPAHKESHYAAHRTYYIKVQVGVLEDGTLEIIK